MVYRDATVTNRPVSRVAHNCTNIGFDVREITAGRLILWTDGGENSYSMTTIVNYNMPREWAYVAAYQRKGSSLVADSGKIVLLLRCRMEDSIHQSNSDISR